MYLIGGIINQTSWRRNVVSDSERNVGAGQSPLLLSLINANLRSYFRKSLRYFSLAITKPS